VQRAVLILSAAILCLGMDAYGWAPATHAYLAERITGSQDPDIIYGSMVVDFYGAVLFNKAANDALHHMTHFDFEWLEPSTFATGFATHNGAWGADYYAHLYYDKTAEPIYSVRKLRQMSSEFNITMQQAEDSWEGIIEFLVRLEYGPELGVLIQQSASGSTHEEALVEAFAQPLAKKTGLSVEEASTEIRKAARAYQTLALTYGQQLAMDQDYLRRLAVIAIRAYLGCDLETAKRYFERGIEISRDDYKQEMDRICENIRAKMISMPQYATHCTPSAAAPERGDP